jgi:dsDNA-specific endonuclease/ATPase MutS2
VSDRKKTADGAGTDVIQNYAQGLLAENDRLRGLLSDVESERSRLEERVRAVEDVLRELDLLRGVVSSLERQNARLQDELLNARDASRRSSRS